MMNYTVPLHLLYLLMVSKIRNILHSVTVLLRAINGNHDRYIGIQLDI